MRRLASSQDFLASVLRRAGSLLLFLAALTTGQPKAEAAFVTVHIVNFDFTSTGIGGAHFNPTIQVGDTVEWIFNQGFHSTTSVAGIAEIWNSTAMASAGQTFDHTFTHIGTFQYYCVIHGADNGNGTASGMSGLVTVTSAATVPEPSSLAMCGIAGVAGLVIAGARRHRAAGRPDDHHPRETEAAASPG